MHSIRHVEAALRAAIDGKNLPRDVGISRRHKKTHDMRHFLPASRTAHGYITNQWTLLIGRQ